MKIYNDMSGYIGANYINLTWCLVTQWIEQKTSKEMVLGSWPGQPYKYPVFLIPMVVFNPPNSTCRAR